MRIPNQCTGFTAECSNYKSKTSYHLSTSTSHGLYGIVPQQSFVDLSGISEYVCGVGTCPIHRCCVGGDCVPCRIVRPR